MATMALEVGIDDTNDADDNSPTMMEAVDIYLRLKTNNDSQTFIRAARRNGETEVTFEYEYGLKGNTPLTASIRIDIVTDEYVIEGGKDKRSSLDSIQQAVFASTLADKKPVSLTH